MSHRTPTCIGARRPRTRSKFIVLLLVASLAGCGAGSGDDKMPEDPGGGGDPPGRGELLDDPPVLVTSLAAGNLLSGLDEPLRQALLLQAGTPVCDVAVYRIRYATVGSRNEATDASGALMVPGGSNDRCRGGRPIVLYAHGTSTETRFDLTRLEDAENAEGLYLAVFFAAQGYIVVAPNYAGYDTSSLPHHPYLVAAQQSDDMIDALSAARSALPLAAASGTTDGGRLYVTGYSQGGYVAMATHRALEAQGKTVTASAPLSGPYALAAFLDAVFFGRVSGGASVFGSFLFTAYQRAYGDVYDSPTQLFESPYAAGIDALLPSALPRSQLYEQGLLARAFFDLTPPAPTYADITPATTPAALAPVFARGFADDHLVTNQYRMAYLQDAEAHPDGGWPVITNAEPAANPALPLRQRLAQNDLRNWTPAAPTLLCGGHDDPTVFWLNTQLMEAYWASHAAAAPYTVLDVDGAESGSSDTYADLKRRFEVAKNLVAAAAILQGATDGGREAVLELYHGGLVSPFCLEAAQEFFEAN